MNKNFRIWAFGDAHVGTDLRFGRESLADAIRQLEADDPDGADGAPVFDWDIAIDVGDMSGGQAVPQDDEGRELVRQFGALRRHAREAVYSVCGNHDRSGLDEPPAWWWRRWVDPFGENAEHSGVRPERRPFAVEGAWERYSFRVGNLLFLMMSDINEPTQTVGRGDLGGNPGGVVSGETFRWWRDRVEANRDAIIVCVHHYVLKDTTVASGAWEGLKKDESGEWRTDYHGMKPQGTPEGASYLYWVDSRPDAGAFESYLAEHPGAVDLWIGGHTHADPDDRRGGKSHVERKWGATFLNAAGLTRHHGRAHHCFPMSRALTFEEGADRLDIRCYLHTSHHAPRGWYEPARRTVPLSRPFRR